MPRKQYPGRVRVGLSQSSKPMSLPDGSYNDDGTVQMVDTHDIITIEISDVNRVVIGHAYLHPHLFHGMLRGRELECVYEAGNSRYAGATAELKRVEIPYEFRGDKAAALAPHETDGWRGRAEDLGNSHRSIRGRDVQTYEVTFTRYIDEDGKPVIS